MDTLRISKNNKEFNNHFRKGFIHMCDQLSALEDEVDVVQFRVMGHKYNLLVNPKYVPELLVSKESHLVKGPQYQLLKPFFGDGLVTSERETHRTSRKLMQPAFYKESIQSYLSQMIADTEEQIQNWKEGQVYPMHEEMMNITLRIICSTMFGNSISHANITRLGKHVDVLCEWFIYMIQSPIPIPTWVPTKQHRKYKAMVKDLKIMVDEIVATRLESGEDHHRDLLQLMIEAIDDEGGRMTPQMLRDQVMTIFLAGHETTANAISFALYRLSKHADIRAKLLAEIDQIVGERDLTLADIPKLTYTKQFISEVLRLHPTVPGISRQVDQPIEIEGYTFQKGELITFPIIAYQRRAEFFEDPFDFHPERFTPDFLSTIPKYAYMPFNMGSRTCIGSNFAWMEATVVLVMIAQRFNLEHVGEEPLQQVNYATMRPVGELPMKIRKRIKESSI